MKCVLSWNLGLVILCTSYRTFFDWVWATWQPYGPHDSRAEKLLERYTRSISASHDLERCTQNGVVPSGEAGCPTQVITCILSSVCLDFSIPLNAESHRRPFLGVGGLNESLLTAAHLVLSTLVFTGAKKSRTVAHGHFCT